MSIKSAREYRAEAARLRKAADDVHLSEHRDTLLTIAGHYEHLAGVAEELRELSHSPIGMERQGYPGRQDARRLGKRSE
jgi:hypothetical protein